MPLTVKKMSEADWKAMPQTQATKKPNEWEDLVNHLESGETWSVDVPAGGDQVKGQLAIYGEESFEINLGGVLNTVLPAMAVMAEQTPGADGLRGRIVAIASLAAFMAALIRRPTARRRRQSTAGWSPARRKRGGAGWH